MKTEIISVSLLIICTVVIFSAITWRMVDPESGSDYYDHILIAKDMVGKGGVETPHFLYQLLLIAVSYLTGVNFQISAVIATVALNVFTAIVVYFLIRSTFGHSASLKTSLMPVAATLSLLVTAPLFFLYLADHHTYFGYIGINVYHNPTMTALKPFAVLLFFLAVGKIEQSVFKKSDLLLLALLSSLSILAKPNFIICFLPAMAIAVTYRFMKGEVVNLTVASSIFLPSAIVLGWQFFATYASSQNLGALDESRIIFAPFQVMAYYSQYLLLKFLLSISFPLVVYILFFKNAVKDKYVNMAWVLFLFGALYTYLLAESGDRMYHANFWWSGQIGLFILFVASAVFFVKQIYSDYSGNKAKIGVGFTVYIFHVVSGIFFYYTQMHMPITVWW